MKSLHLPVVAALLISACGHPAPEAPLPPARTTIVASPPREKPVTLAALDVDPVQVGLGRREPGAGSSAEDVQNARVGIGRLCDEGLAKAAALLADVRAASAKSDAELTWENAIAPLDQARLALRNAGDFPGLMAVAHPDEATRDAAKACEPKMDQFETGMWLDAQVAAVVKRYAAKRESLSVPRARLVERLLRDFRRNGLDLDAEKQARVRTLNEQLTRATQEFDSNIAAAKLFIEATPAELEGLPSEWLTAHPVGDNGKIKVSTDYPDYFPVLTYAKNRDVALALYKQFDNRAADKNVTLLDQILKLRKEKATLLGYATWADYVLEPRMAKDAKTVARFLEGLRTHLVKKGKAELAEFEAFRKKLGIKPGTPIPPSDRLYLEDQVRKAKYGLDSKEVSQYFEVSQVKAGLLTITSKLFGISYRPANVPTWHADVEAMEVVDANGALLGRFYFDLHSREGKYKHAAVFSIRDTAKLASGERLVPIAAIECNFPRPAPNAPALMSHQDAVTFFHEFGHVLHHMLSESELSTFAGTSVARDFVESPSQMLEGGRGRRRRSTCSPCTTRARSRFRRRCTRPCCARVASGVPSRRSGSCSWRRSIRRIIRASPGSTAPRCWPKCTTHTRHSNMWKAHTSRRASAT